MQNTRINILYFAFSKLLKSIYKKYIGTKTMYVESISGFFNESFESKKFIDAFDKKQGALIRIETRRTPNERTR